MAAHALKSEVEIRGPLRHQLPIDQSPARYKVVRAGRRFGKTVLAFKCAMVGHGPTQADGRPMFPGVFHGGDVIWIARDYKQAGIVWAEEIYPRFRDVDGVALDHTDHDVKIDGVGQLLIRSAENITSVKGSGQNLLGVVVEEAAWLDLQDALQTVILAALLDNDGWLLLISTTNGGQDGNKDKAIPSYFNRICQEILDGQRSSEWAHFHGTARDNPKIGPVRLQKLIDEYPAGSVQLAQEVEAELVQGGAGLAFPEWSTSVHVVSWEPPPGWGWAGGFDWGYESPGWCGIARLDGTEGGMFREELAFRRMTAYEVGQKVGRLLQLHDFTPQFPIFADPSAFNPLDGRPTFAQDVQRGLSDVLQQRSPVLVPAAQVRSDGKSPRIFGKLLMHKALRWGPYAEDGTLPNHLRPRWVVHKACSELARSIASLPIDERNIEDVDTEAFDHPYDGARYLLQSQYMPEVSKPERKKEHIHPGWAKDEGGQLVRANRIDPAVRPRFRTTFSMRNEGEN